VQRPQHRHRGHRRAVGVGDYPLAGLADGGRVDLRHDQRDVRIHRQAEELSITRTPAAANFGASAFEVDAPAENHAMSSPDGSAVAASSTVISPSAHRRVVPAERAEAKNRISAIGNFRSARISRITFSDLAGRTDHADPQAPRPRLAR